MSAPEPLYRPLHEATRFAAGAQDEVAIEPLSGRPVLLSAQQAKLLAALRGERSLDDHAAGVAPRLAMDLAQCRALVEGLARKGLLVTEASLREHLAGAPRAPRQAARIASLGIPTNNRAASLIECVRSHAEAARRRGVEIVIADSSAGAAAEPAHRALRELLGRGVALRHAPPQKRPLWARTLAHLAGVDPALAEFALCGDARIGGDSGANRNALLLDGAGEALLFTDDDVRARAVPSPNLRSTLALVSGDPTEAWFAEPGAPLVRDAEWRAVDPFALHETLLGADAAHLVAEPFAGAPADLRRAGAALIRRLSRRGGRVATTQLGCAGDHGMGGSFALLLFAGATRQRLLASPETFRDAFTRRLLVRSAGSPVLADTAHCMAMSLGVDARDLVPPFAPAGRDSDGFFGVLLRASGDAALAGFLPQAIEHSPPEARSASLEREQALAGTGGANEHLRIVIAAAFEPQGSGARDGLPRLGALLERLASRPLDAEQLFREHTMRALARRLAQIERLLAEHGRRPEHWAQALDGFAAAMRAALTAPSAYLPGELVAAHGEDTARALFFDYMARLGRLLVAWPALFDAARELRARGDRLAVIP